MIKFNWAQYLAEQLRPIVSPYPVYSYCNPAREYNGETLVEFNENEQLTQTLLNGDELRQIKLVVSCRAPKYEQAAALIEATMKALEEVLQNVVFYWEEEGVDPDVRGIVEGESFHGYAQFTILEKVKL